MIDRINEDWKHKLLRSVNEGEIINEGKSFSQIASSSNIIGAIKQFDQDCKEFVKQSVRDNGANIKQWSTTLDDSTRRKRYCVTFSVEPSAAKKYRFFMITMWADNTVIMRPDRGTRITLKNPTDQECYEWIQDWIKDQR